MGRSGGPSGGRSGGRSGGSFSGGGRSGGGFFGNNKGRSLFSGGRSASGQGAARGQCHRSECQALQYVSTGEVSHCLPFSSKPGPLPGDGEDYTGQSLAAKRNTFGPSCATPPIALPHLPWSRPCCPSVFPGLAARENGQSLAQPGHFSYIWAPRGPAWARHPP